MVLVSELEDPNLYLNRNFAKSYGNNKNSLWTRLCRELVDDIQLVKSDIVADLGCGTGYATKEILKKGVLDVYAIDPSSAMLDEAGNNLNGCKVIQGTIDHLIDTKLKKPNIIVSSGSFVVMDNPADVLKKIYSYLDQGGRYIFTVEDWSNSNVNGEPMELFFQKVKECRKKLGLETNCTMFKGGQKYSKKEVEKMIITSGGNIVKSYTKEMSIPAINKFPYQGILNMVDIITRNLSFKHRLSSQIKDRKKLFDQYKALYSGKKWVNGLQYVFDTVK